MIFVSQKIRPVECSERLNSKIKLHHSLEAVQTSILVIVALFNKVEQYFKLILFEGSGKFVPIIKINYLWLRLWNKKLI